MNCLTIPNNRNYDITIILSLADSIEILLFKFESARSTDQ